MRVVGWLLVATGLALVLWSVTITTTVHTDSSYLAGVGYQAPSDTYNLGLLQQQMMLLHSGLCLFLAGVVAACLGDLRAGMRRAGTLKYDGIFETEPPADTPSTEQTAITE